MGEPSTDEVQFIQSRIATSTRENDSFDENSKVEDYSPTLSGVEYEKLTTLRYQKAQKAAEDARNMAQQAYAELEAVEREMIRLNLKTQGKGEGVQDVLLEKAKLQKQYQTESAPRKNTGQATFDISVNAFKRDSFLEYSLQEYIGCHPDRGANDSSLKHIFVIWNDMNRTIPDSLKKYEKTGFVTFYRTSGEDRLSNRFTPLNYSSDAVFHVDDDQPHMCQTLHDMFAIWQTDPDGMVGTSPRKKDLMEGGQECWACPLIWGEYNIVFLTKGAFMHKRFFEEYWKPVWKPIRDVVDEHNCGEDFLMSAVHASVVGSRRVYAIAGSVNKGSFMVKETRHLTKELNIVEEYSGLNVRTWESRGKVTDAIAKFLAESFPEEARQGHFSRLTKQWWRSNLGAGQSCREQTIPCYNRAWDSCSVECDVQVRGSMACFTGDSACFSGLHLGTPMDFSEQDQVVCVGDQCTF